MRGDLDRVTCLIAEKVLVVGSSRSLTGRWVPASLQASGTPSISLAPHQGKLTESPGVPRRGLMCVSISAGDSCAV